MNKPNLWAVDDGQCPSQRAQECSDLKIYVMPSHDTSAEVQCCYSNHVENSLHERVRRRVLLPRFFEVCVINGVGCVHGQEPDITQHDL
jgi:hypothetical protein